MLEVAFSLSFKAAAFISLAYLADYKPYKLSTSLLVFLQLLSSFVLQQLRRGVYPHPSLLPYYYTKC